MDYWNILEIEPTSNKIMIQKAYAKLTLKYHPEEYPEQFQKIHSAYLSALKYARYQKKLEKQFTEQAQAETYDFFNDSKGDHEHQSLDESKKSLGHDFFNNSKELLNSHSLNDNKNEKQKTKPLVFSKDSKNNDTEACNKPITDNEKDYISQLYDFDEILNNWQTLEDISFEFEETLYTLPRNNISFAEVSIWEKFLQSEEFLGYLRLPNFSDILISYINTRQENPAYYYRLLYTHLKKQKNKENALKVLHHLRKKVIFLNKKAFAFLLATLALLFLIAGIFYWTMSNTSNSAKIRNFLEEKYDMDFTVEYIALFEGPNSKEYEQYKVIKNQPILNDISKSESANILDQSEIEESYFDIKDFAIYLEKDVDEIVILDGYMRSILSYIGNHYSFYRPINFYEESENNENYLGFTYDLSFGIEIFMEQLKEIERTIQSTFLLDGTIIEIEIFPIFEGKHILEEVIVFDITKNETTNFDKLNDSLTMITNALDLNSVDNLYLYTQQIEDFYEDKYLKNFNVEYMSISETSDLIEYHTFDVTWDSEPVLHLYDIDKFQTFIKVGDYNYIPEDDYLRTLLEVFAYNISMTNGALKNRAITVAERPEYEESSLRLTYDLEFPKEDFVSSFMEMEMTLQNCMISDGTVLNFEIYHENLAEGEMLSFKIIIGETTNYDELYGLLSKT